MSAPAPAAELSSRDLRERWFERSVTSGWAFVSDWHNTAVDALCEARVTGTGLWPAAERLGAFRARAGVSLGETLADIDALAQLFPDLHADAIYRAVSLGWADGMQAPRTEVVDPLTGLVVADYLSTRMGEIYQAADVAGRRVSAVHALVVVQLNLTGRQALDRVGPLILAAEAMRTVFDGGETLARLSLRMAVALTDRERMLARRAGLLAELITAQFGGKAAPRPARVWIESLPDALSAARNLITELGR